MKIPKPFQAAESPETVIFLHIPKTAGTTLDQIIYRHYRNREIYGTGRVAQQGVTDFKNMDVEKRQKYRLIKGHLSFGFHEHIPGPWAYFTFFRNPIERTISHFYFMLRTPEHPIYDLIHENNMGLEQVLEAGLNPMLHNGHTRLLSGVWAEPRAGTCTREDLEIAKANLRQIKVVGLTEKFDASLLLLGQAFGWNNLFYTKKNVTAGRPARQHLSPNTLAMVHAANELDNELYGYAKEIFDDQIQKQGENFANRVSRFQRYNRFIRPLVDRYWDFRKVSVRTLVRERLTQSRPED